MARLNSHTHLKKSMFDRADDRGCRTSLLRLLA